MYHKETPKKVQFTPENGVFSMFSIMIVKHHYETLLEYKRKEVLVKRIDVSVVSSPLTPQAKYRALYFPGFAG